MVILLSDAYATELSSIPWSKMFAWVGFVTKLVRESELPFLFALSVFSGSSTDHETKWTCQKCGRVVGVSTPTGFATDSVLPKQEPESVVENAVACSDVEIVDRKSIDKNEAAVKTPRSRDESKQRHVTGECSPNHLPHPKVSDDKDSDTKAADSGVQQPPRKFAKEEICEVTCDKEPSAIILESPGKRLYRPGQEAEAGEILEVDLPSKLFFEALTFGFIFFSMSSRFS